MKRTEKIEVRLSHEEKQSLSRLAEGEGRTISDLVRGLIERYVSLNTARLPQKRRWGLWAGLVTSGLLIGHLGTWGFSKKYASTEMSGEPSYTAYGVYKLSMIFPDTTSDKKIVMQMLEVPFLLQDASRQEHLVEREGNDFLVSSFVTMSNEMLPTVEFTICEIVVNDCRTIAEPKLTLAPDLATSVSLMTDSRHGIGLTIEPSSTKVKLKKSTRVRTFENGEYKSETKIK